MARLPPCWVLGALVEFGVCVVSLRVWGFGGIDGIGFRVWGIS